MNTPDVDSMMMLKAIALGERGRVTAPPNPWVGCILVKDGVVVGEGFHHAAGEPHAEVMALQIAGERARGATCYVTLEPCAHHGNTPPCTDALIAHGIARVVTGVKDPDARVSGKGVKLLRDAGIEVFEGCEAEKVAASLVPYLHHRRTGTPYCVLKAAVSVDGRIAARDGTSQWISSEAARRDTQQLRAESQAILVGVGTIHADDPRLTVREAPTMPTLHPLRVVLDQSGTLKPDARVCDCSLAPTLVITGQGCPQRKILSWQERGCRVASVRGHGGKLDLKQVLQLLGERGVIQVLVEGGSRVYGAFFRDKLFQKVVVYVGPVVLGSGGIPFLGDDFVATLHGAPRLKLVESLVLGDTVKTTYLA